MVGGRGREKKRNEAGEKGRGGEGKGRGVRKSATADSLLSCFGLLGPHQCSVAKNPLT